MGAKLSILDVRCRDRSGTTFVVEMQLIHVPGFINRVVYNACKAVVSQLTAPERYSQLTDVVAISICDFELWPDAKQDEKGLARVPMLSRWNMTERASGTQGLLQVQYAFLELPKLPADRPSGPGADLWAWLFVHAPTFTQAELFAYEKVIAEIGQARELVEAKLAEGLTKGEAIGFTKGEASGFTKGEASGVVKGKIGALLAIVAARGIAVTEKGRVTIETCRDEVTLDRWIARATTALSLEEILA